MDNNNVDMFSEALRNQTKANHNDTVIQQQKALLKLNTQMLNNPGASKELKAVAQKYLDQMENSIQELEEENNQFRNPCQ